MSESNRTSTYNGLELPLEKEDPTSATPSNLSVLDAAENNNATDKENTTAADLARVVSSEYPTQAKLIVILLAVVLSVFLVALDMVRIFFA